MSKEGKEKKEDLKKEGSEKKEENISKPDFIKWFSELNKDSGSVAGGKGANLAEIYNLKVPVPAGFAITAQAYDYLIKTAGVEDKINELTERISYEDEDGLNEITSEIREIVEGIKFPEEMKKEIYEAYEDLSAADDQGFQKSSAHEILKKSPEFAFVAVRSSATTEDLADASFAGQQETFLNVKGKRDLIKSVKKCFSSLFTPRATFYRNRKGFEHSESKISVIVQRMVDADKSGVIFSKDPSTGEDKVVIEAVWGLGEGIVSGKITPDKYIVSNEEIEETEVAEKKIAITRNSAGDKNIVKLSPERSKRQVLKNYEIKKLAQMALKLEKHYDKPQDIEFAIEGEEIYIVQTRPITTVKGKPQEAKEIRGSVVLKGLAASPGIGTGKIRIIKDMKDLNKIKKGDVLVTGMTNPDMVVSMQKSSAIVTDEGGLTAHAAIVSREMGIPAVVGTQEATTKLKDGEMITVDGFTGRIYKGKVSENVQKEIHPVTAKTKTKIKVILDLPSYAERAAKTGLKGVGLARIEGIIAESGKHPEYYLKKGQILSDYTEVIYRGIKKMARHFNEIWVRTSDIRSDEFSNLEGAPELDEANPMLGMHGIRYGIKNPEILKAELKALRRVANDSSLGETKIGILLPQVINLFEVEEVKKFLEEIDFKDAKVGVMIETPASVQLIPEFCKAGIDFVSFGTNDLTQYILAVDRGNGLVQGLYDEMHPAILYQLEYVIRVAKRNNVETSICGQSGSKKPMVKYLVERGIDSISVNADVAKEISDYVHELETGQKTEESEDEDKPEEKSENGTERDEQKENKNDEDGEKEHKQEENKNEENKEEKNKEDNFQENEFVPPQKVDSIEKPQSEEKENIQTNKEQTEEIRESQKTKEEMEDLGQKEYYEETPSEKEINKEFEQNEEVDKKEGHNPADIENEEELPQINGASTQENESEEEKEEDVILDIF